MCGVEAAPVCGRGGRHQCERHTVISTEAAHVPMEERGQRKTFEEEGGDEHDECEGGGDERTSGRGGRISKLVREGLYAELEIGTGHVEPKGLTGEHSNVFQEVAP